MSDTPYSATANASGVATITISPSQKLRAWVVQQVSIEVSGEAPFGATATLRKNGQIVSPMIAQQDTAGGDPPVALYGSDVLTVTWTGLTSGQAVKAFVIYEEVRGR